MEQDLQTKYEDLKKVVDEIKTKAEEAYRKTSDQERTKLNRNIDEDSKRIIREAVQDTLDSFSSTLTTAITPVRYDAGNSSTSLTLDFDNGRTQFVTLTGNCTFTFSNPVEGRTYILELLQDGTGSRTVTFPSTVKWSNGVAPTLTTTAGQTDIITLYYNGTNYAGAYTLNYTI